MVLGAESPEHINQSLAAAGLIADQELKPEVIEIWPDNWQAVQAANQLCEQYNIAPSGAVLGFRMEAMESIMRIMQIPINEQAELLQDLRFMGKKMAEHLNE